MTIDNMFKTMSKFFDDPKNKGYTSAAENIWWFVHVFSDMTFENGKGTSRVYLSRVLDGPFKDEIKPLVKYVQHGGIVLKLYETGGPGFTQ